MTTANELANAFEKTLPKKRKSVYNKHRLSGRRWTTKKAKRAKKMDAVSKIFLHAEKRYATGHTIVGAAFVYRGVVVPCAVRLWASKESCNKMNKNINEESEKIQPLKLTELAADCIKKIRLPSSGKVIVLFDKFYLCDTVVAACNEKKYDYIVCPVA